MVAVGLFATVAAAVLATDKPLGSAHWNGKRRRRCPTRSGSAIPGGGAMQIARSRDPRSERTNVGGYRLFRVCGGPAASLAGSAIGQARVRCAHRRAAIGRIPDRPDPEQPRRLSPAERRRRPAQAGRARTRSNVEFNSHGTEFASVEFDDALSAVHDPPRRGRELGPVQAGAAGMAVGPALRAARRSRWNSASPRSGAPATPPAAANLLHARDRGRQRDRPNRRAHRGPDAVAYG